jgi:hypothetical protein
MRCSPAFSLTSVIRLAIVASSLVDFGCSRASDARDASPTPSSTPTLAPADAGSSVLAPPAAASAARVNEAMRGGPLIVSRDGHVLRVDDQGRVRDVTTGSPPLARIGTHKWNAWPLAADRDAVYAMDDNQDIAAFSRAGEALGPIFRPRVKVAFPQLFVDDRFIYVLHYGSSAAPDRSELARAPKSGGPLALVARFQGQLVHAAFDGTHVYGDRDAGKRETVIERVAASGGPVTALLRTPDIVTDLAVEGGYLFYVAYPYGNKAPVLRRARVSGGAETELFVGGTDASPGKIGHLAVAGDSLYFASAAKGGGWSIQVLRVATRDAPRPSPEPLPVTLDATPESIVVVGDELFFTVGETPFAVESRLGRARIR